MTTIVTRAGKGSPLTHTEVDTNFTNLNTAKLETAAIPLGTLAAPSISFTGDANTGAYSPGADTLALVTAGANRLHITSGGLVGLGTSGPSNKLTIYDAAANPLRLIQDHGTSSAYGLEFYSAASTPYVVSSLTASHGAAYVNPYLDINVSDTSRVLQQRVRIDASGRVGIGTTPAAGSLLHINSAASTDCKQQLSVTTGTQAAFTAYVSTTVSTVGTENSTGGSLMSGSAPYATVISNGGAYPINFGTNNSIKATIDSSGRLLVGTSSVTGIPATLNVIGGNNTVLHSQSATADSPFLFLSHARGTGVQSVNAQDGVGAVAFVGYDGTNALTAARIEAFVDGTPGANDMPGRLVFSTTADGASSPTERVRITQSGLVGINRSSTIFAANEIFTVQGASSYNIDSIVQHLNRTNDGTIVNFYINGTAQGSISVSGSTVSYNGAHLSRWSQLPGGATREEILRGTVLSNIDEMCGWGDEENEQLNRMKVSDVEGDKNVSGVFQCWDDDDDTYVDDFYCAMTGDFIIRIAKGVTVERGDLLMSAGDGTAKPQDDDIIRSKTIAKVTSTHVTCTYEDGSYCVPCVLMAC
jgi:hypothetical protein